MCRELEHERSNVVTRSTAENRAVVSADTDFGTILALREARWPSVVLWRRASPRRPEDQAPIFLRVLEISERALSSGAIVVIEANRIRVRKLPIGGGA